MYWFQRFDTMSKLREFVEYRSLDQAPRRLMARLIILIGFAATIPSISNAGGMEQANIDRLPWGSRGFKDRASITSELVNAGYLHPYEMRAFALKIQDDAASLTSRINNIDTLPPEQQRAYFRDVSMLGQPEVLKALRVSFEAGHVTEAQDAAAAISKLVHKAFNSKHLGNATNREFYPQLQRSYTLWDQGIQGTAVRDDAVNPGGVPALEDTSKAEVPARPNTVRDVRQKTASALVRTKPDELTKLFLSVEYLAVETRRIYDESSMVQVYIIAKESTPDGLRPTSIIPLVEMLQDGLFETARKVVFRGIFHADGDFDRSELIIPGIQWAVLNEFEISRNASEQH
jgi:hypothetical protein